VRAAPGDGGGGMAWRIDMHSHARMIAPPRGAAAVDTAEVRSHPCVDCFDTLRQPKTRLHAQFRRIPGRVRCFQRAARPQADTCLAAIAANAQRWERRQPARGWQSHATIAGLSAY
jgi:hypothetical protein